MTGDLSLVFLSVTCGVTCRVVMQWSALEDHEVLQEDRVLTVASSGMSASKPTKGLELEHSQFFWMDSCWVKGLRICPIQIVTFT